MLRDNTKKNTPISCEKQKTIVKEEIKKKKKITHRICYYTGTGCNIQAFGILLATTNTNSTTSYSGYYLLLLLLLLLFITITFIHKTNKNSKKLILKKRLH